jgi:hypothetical protein
MVVPRNVVFRHEPCGIECRVDGAHHPDRNKADRITRCGGEGILIGGGLNLDGRGGGDGILVGGGPNRDGGGGGSAGAKQGCSLQQDGEAQGRSGGLERQYIDGGREKQGAHAS